MAFSSIKGVVGVITDTAHPLYAEVVHFIGDYNPDQDTHITLTTQGVDVFWRNQLFFTESDQNFEAVCQRLKNAKEEMVLIQAILRDPASTKAQREEARAQLGKILNGTSVL